MMTASEDNLANRACQLTREFIGHALKVRKESPEYAPSPEQTSMILGMELSRLAKTAGGAQQQAILDGLNKGLQQLKLSDAERLSILTRLAPQIKHDDT